MTVRTRPLRSDELEHFEKLARRVASLSDDELGRLHRRWRDRILSIIEDWKWTESGSGGAWDDPVELVEIAMSDILTIESNHRRGVIWEAEADMQGGHYVVVGYGDRDPKKFHAWCFPYGDICWEGPDRETVAEATEDGRRHNPGYEPKPQPWIEGDTE